jgi:hypothetical protein
MLYTPTCLTSSLHPPSGTKRETWTLSESIQYPSLPLDPKTQVIDRPQSGPNQGGWFEGTTFPLPLLLALCADVLELQGGRVRLDVNHIPL